MFFFMIIVVLFLVTVVSMMFYIISYSKLVDHETFSSYECGFNIMSTTRIFFSFRFFLIAILFLIFDVEIVLMLPIPFLVFNLDILITICFFLSVLVLGLMYEYYYGSLNWLQLMNN